ncbi:MAG: Modification methylase HhaI [Firmicutes bacterium ADurb.Bin146]|nr:MAG: Modification methylase HhaI [Firmicutes bacterium ADurb.Bin146]
MSSKLTLGSLFDGSGGFPLGGLLCGIEPVWASEIEPFPIRVTTKRLPFVKHYGDVSKMDGGSIEPVDIITFGSPCQDMSVAGKRDGLDGSRSSLFYEAVRIVKEMRCKTDGKYPKYIVWENVPGAFSSNKGEDFRCVLESICRICDETAAVPSADKWQSAGEIVGTDYSIAWRVLDAQHWGVPQRRKRIYLVADFTGGCAGKILFESEGLSGYSQESFRAWQRTAADFTEGTGAAGREDGSLVLCDQGGNRMDVLEEKTSTLRAEAHHPPIVIENHPADSRVKISEDGVVQTLSGRCGTGGNNVPLLLKIRSGCEGGGKGALIQEDKSATLSCNNDQTLFEPKVYGICSKGSNAMKSDNPKSGFYEAETTRTLDGNGGRPDCAQGGMAVVSIEGNGTRPSHNGDGWSEKDVSYTLNATEQHGVAYGIGRDAFNQGQNAKYKPAVEEELQPTIVAKGPGAVAEPTFSSSKASFFTEAAEDMANTLVASDYKDPPIVNDRPAGKEETEPDYIVRRLTPTECARLQGFPDWWCSDLGTEHPTNEEVYEWYKIFETHREVMGSSSKPKTEKQIRAFLKDPHSDSAEYKMWGNGVALPCVYFVLSAIAWVHSKTS